MATSDDKRREVAARLRITKSECESRDYPWMVEDLLQALGFERYEDAENGIFDRLADLIDRPTCDDVGDDWTFRCSACGSELDIRDAFEDEPTMWKDGAAEVPKYCPNCGAKVVRTDD